MPERQRAAAGSLQPTVRRAQQVLLGRMTPSGRAGRPGSQCQKGREMGPPRLARTQTRRRWAAAAWPAWPGPSPARASSCVHRGAGVRAPQPARRQRGGSRKAGSSTRLRLGRARGCPLGHGNQTLPSNNGAHSSKKVQTSQPAWLRTASTTWR